MTIREFTCKYCQHKVVVRPELPPDYEPNVCTPCYDVHVRPRMQKLDQEIMEKAAELLLKLCGLPDPRSR